LGVERTEIEMAYRVMLGREPLDEETEIWRNAESISELRRAFIESAEFKSDFLKYNPAQNAWKPPIERKHLPVEWQTEPETQAALLAYVQTTWTKLGLEEPHWSVLASEDWKASNIEKNKVYFYQSGARDTALISAILSRHEAVPESFGRVLEYGCGVGRVTLHLASMFAHVTAVDISRSHLALAEAELHAHGATNVAFVQAELPDFGMTAPFDLWFTRIVLQHNPPPVIAMILRRMFACLAPGGLAIFQLCTYVPGYRFSVADYLGQPKQGEIEVHCLPQQIVFQLAQEAGCLCLEVTPDNGMPPPWASDVFVFHKTPPA